MRFDWTTWRTGIAALCGLYAVVLYAWYLARLVLGDRWTPLAVLNIFALYLFAPLPLVLIAGIVVRRPLAWLSGGAVMLLFVALYGNLFWPFAARERAEHNALCVLTHNVPYYHNTRSIDRLVSGVLAEDPDIVFFQELTRPTLVALRERFKTAYPYQLDTSASNEELKLTLSRYPLHLEQVVSPAASSRPTLIAVASTPGGDVVLVNIHPTATPAVPERRLFLPVIERTVARREMEIAAALAALEGEIRPIIWAGDMNTTDQTAAYTMVSRRLQDSWREVGTGFGHTFPARRFYFGPFPVPVRLIRIDYIFHSSHFRAVAARRLDLGASDHIAVVAQLAWNDEDTGRR